MQKTRCWFIGLVDRRLHVLDPLPPEMPKRLRAEANVSLEAVETFRTSSIVIRDCLTPPELGWRGDKYMNIVKFYQRILLSLKHMEPPPKETFASWVDSSFVPQNASTLIDSIKTHPIQKAILCIEKGDKGELHGWNDLFAAFCFVHAYYTQPMFLDVLNSALKEDKVLTASTRGPFYTQTRLEATLELFQNAKRLDLQVRCTNLFFEAIHSRNPKMALDMKDALVYPPCVETKEEKRHREALSIVSEIKHDEEF